MNVSPINTIRPNFKGIYSNSSFKYSSEQEKVMLALTDKLRSDEFKDSKGRTLEQQYESRNMDFVFDKGYEAKVYWIDYTPTEPPKENVGLLLISDKKAAGSKSKHVGYFSMDNIDSLKSTLDKSAQQLKANRNNFLYFPLAMLTLAAALITGCFFGAKISKPAAEEVTKQAVAAGDTVLNYVKDLPKDSLTLKKGF